MFYNLKKGENMKVLLVNGSSKKKECVFTALSIIEKSLNKEGIDTEIIQLGSEAIRDCIGCGACKKNGENECIFKDDIVNEIIKKAKEADGFIFGTPVYYAHPSGRLLSLMDRLFYAGSSAFAFKPAAAIASARRSGTTASLDAIMKHFTINCMPVVSSNYWNMVHGNTAKDVLEDKEGCQIMENLGTNMAWLIKSLDIAKESGINKPNLPEKVWTNFIR